MGKGISWAAAGLLVVAVLGLAFFGGFLKAPGSATGAVIGVPVQTGGPAVIGQCVAASTGLNSVLVAARNRLSSTLGYAAGTAQFVGASGVAVATGTTNAGTSLTYLTLSPPACTTGTLALLSGAGAPNGVTGGKVTYTNNKAGQESVFDTDNQSMLTFQLYDTAFANASASSPNNSAHSAATAMASGGILDRVLDVNVNGTNAAFGAKDIGGLIVVDLPTNAFSTTSGFTLTAVTAGYAPTKVDCGSLPGVGSLVVSADLCYKIPQLNPQVASPVRFNLHLNADLADPGATDDITIRFLDGAYFNNPSGVFAEGYATSVGGDVGDLGLEQIVLQLT